MVTIVVDGFYGSCAKGKCAVRLAQKSGNIAVRTGGPNAGHVCYPNGLKYTTRQLPSPLAVPGVRLCIGAGGMVDASLLERELTALEDIGLKDIRERLWIDPYASLVDDNAGDIEKEQLGLGDRLGSTQTGTGWTQSQRVLRKARCVKDSGLLTRYIHDVTREINQTHDSGKHVIIEGTQGFGLSNYHGGCYPYCTSRDTSASNFASEAGISPRIVNCVWMVIRTFPIRVGGNSGPMKDEITWKQVAMQSGATNDLTEMTSVTKKVRRVGLFDWELLERACMVNRPDFLAIHGMDYLDVKNYGVNNYGMLTSKAWGFISEVERRSGVKVGMVFTGPLQEHLIELKK